MASRVFAFVVWAAAAAGVMFWVLRLAGGSQPMPAHAVAVGEDAVVRGDLARLFGREAAPVAGVPAVAASSSLKLVGVVAPKAGSGLRAGVALISVEGKPARPYKVGASVNADLLLLEVHQRGASLGPRDGAPTMALELPLAAPPARGTLPPPGVAAAAAVLPAARPIAIEQPSTLGAVPPDTSQRPTEPVERPAQ